MAAAVVHVDVLILPVVAVVASVLGVFDRSGAVAPAQLVAETDAGDEGERTDESDGEDEFRDEDGRLERRPLVPGISLPGGAGGRAFLGGAGGAVEVAKAVGFRVARAEQESSFRAVSAARQANPRIR